MGIANPAIRKTAVERIYPIKPHSNNLLLFWAFTEQPLRADFANTENTEHSRHELGTWPRYFPRRLENIDDAFFKSSDGSSVYCCLWYNE